MSASASAVKEHPSICIEEAHQTICIKNVENYTHQYINGTLVLTLLKSVITAPDNTCTYLNLYNKQYKELPELPPILNLINCSFNKLTQLPENLPESLIYLFCNHNNLTQLPEHLPKDLIQLYCFDNQLTQLPENLPEGLLHLHCYNNELTKLPEKLPQGLKYLYCNNNQLTELSENLPEGLLYLHCYNNKLTKLPEKLPQGLKYLYCNNNQLDVLPDLPNTLIELRCADNNLQKNYPDIDNYSNINDRIEYINRRNHEMRKKKLHPPELVSESWVAESCIYGRTLIPISCIIRKDNKDILNINTPDLTFITIMNYIIHNGNKHP